MQHSKHFVGQVFRFCELNLEHDEDAVLLKDELYALYQNQGGDLARNAFFRKLKQIVDVNGLLVTIKKPHTDGTRRLFTKGVKLK